METGSYNILKSELTAAASFKFTENVSFEIRKYFRQQTLGKHEV